MVHHRGYIGYEEGGQLTEKIRRKPYSVILFDEIEKSHLDVLNILLQILEDGRLTDSAGRVINFKNTVIIMTSNIGAKLITNRKTLGFSSDNIIENDKKEDIIDYEYEKNKNDVISELKKEFRPEFINRIDEIIVFHKLSKQDIREIIDIMLKQVVKRLDDQNIKIKISDDVKKLISEKGYDQSYGARPLRRAIQTMFEDRVAEAILDGVIKTGKQAMALVENEEIKIR